MRELVYYVAVSLDGYIAGPEGEFDAFLDEGDHMAVLLEEFADAIPRTSPPTSASISHGAASALC